MMKDRKVFQMGFNIAMEFAPSNYNVQAYEWSNPNYISSQVYSFNTLNDVLIVGIDSYLLCGDTTGSQSGNNVTNYSVEVGFFNSAGLPIENPYPSINGPLGSGVGNLYTTSYFCRSAVVTNFSNGLDLTHRQYLAKGLKPLGINCNLDPKNALSGSIPVVLDLYLNVHYQEIE